MSDLPEHSPGDEHRPQAPRQAQTNNPDIPAQDRQAGGSTGPSRGDRKPRGDTEKKRSDAKKMRTGDKRRSPRAGQRSTPPGKNTEGRGFKGSSGSKPGRSGRPAERKTSRKRPEDSDADRQKDRGRTPFRRQNKPESKGQWTGRDSVPRTPRRDDKSPGDDRPGRPRPDRRAESGRNDGRRPEAAKRGKPPRPPEEPKPNPDPAVPAEVTGDELDRESKAELRTLPKDLATEIARHLVMAGQLLGEDPEEAHRHALAARRKAARVGVVREACGLTAYHAGMWSVALAELRTARRLTGQEAHLPVMADAERGLGRPERALDLARSDEARRLSDGDAVEMRIVESGARRDLGQHDAAILALQIPELKEERLRPWSARLFYAYADALAEADRRDEASRWFARAAAADRDGETGAAERYAELEGLEIIDTEDEWAEPGEQDPNGSPGSA
jgi:hypothetical protein